MGKFIMHVVGADGQVELMSDRVIIHRKGFLNMFKYGLKQRKEIPLMSISSLDFQDATFFRPGHIRFDYAGRNQQDESENNVKFQRKSNRDFVTLKEEIFAMMHQGRK